MKQRNILIDLKITQIDIAFLRYRHPIHSGAYLSSQSAVIRSIIPFCFKELVNFGFSMNSSVENQLSLKICFSNDGKTKF